MEPCRGFGYISRLNRAHIPRLRISGDVRPRESPRDGRWGPANNTAEVIDLNQFSPTWRAVGSMAFARRQLNATLLPDGTVLVTGGTSAPGGNNPAGAVRAAELWNPTTEEWTTLASSSAIPRIYHSTALLLPDARVLSMGGDGFPQTEIYSPPYLFWERGPRSRQRRPMFSTDSPSSSKRQTSQRRATLMRARHSHSAARGMPESQIRRIDHLV